MKYVVTLERRTIEVGLGDGGTTVDGRAVAADLEELAGSGVVSLILDGRSHRFLARADGRGTWVLGVGGRAVQVRVLDERRYAIQQLGGGEGRPKGPRVLKAPMPGLVVKVEVSEGDRVEPGQGLVIVEAMKMENELRADVAAVVTAVRVSGGETVEKDQVLLELSPAPED